MVKLLSLVLLAGSCSAGALPFGGVGGFTEKGKRQLDKIGPLLSLKGAALGHFMGETAATDALIGLARMMGASKTAPGGLGKWAKDIMNNGYGIIPETAGAAPRRVKEESRTPEVPGSTTIKIRYGPYKVPGMNKLNMLGQGGMLANYPHDNMEKPCSGDCTILGITAGLEYPDGKNANIDTGLWLHHMVMFNKGPGRSDPTCNDFEVSVPHNTVGGTSRSSERFFASGNERSVANFPKWGVKDAGYKIRSTDTFASLVEFMNENMDDKVVYMTITYDIVEGHPFKDDVKVVWFDIRQCGTSEANPPKGQDRFSFDYKWKSTIDGEVIGSIGHLHDGGDQLTMNVEGENTCTNTASYGTKPEYVQKTAMGHHANGALTHISDMKVCHGESLPKKQMKVGQTWGISADYDFGKYKGMKHDDGSWDEVMGIAITFVRVKN